MQTDDNFEVVIADDGSKEETRQLVERFQAESQLDIQHVWHEDDGFQKCLILNKALIASKGDYIVVTDGDCIPRQDFIAVHRQHAEPGCYLSGGYFKLPMSTSEKITRDDIQSQRCFNKQWLIEHDVSNTHKLMKLTAQPWQASIYNRLTFTNRTWNGHNASCFKEEAFRINGFDERMRYGGQDCEFGHRLVNAGLKPKQIRYSAVVIHLDHARGYRNDEDWKKNRAIRDHTLKAKVIETPAGIKQHADQMA